MRKREKREERARGRGQRGRERGERERERERDEDRDRDRFSEEHLKLATMQVHAVWGHYKRGQPDGIQFPAGPHPVL